MTSRSGPGRSRRKLCALRQPGKRERCTDRLFRLIRIGATHPYVLHALLSFSAMHLAYLTGCPVVGNMAYEHRGIAFKRLQGAIETFSPETSDAILAASLVLSWQSTDW